jgi:nicotinate-nucleotide adenylyltransferase
MTKLERIGLLSGTFDPVHNGHLAFARQAIKEHDLKSVVFLVEPEPRHKPSAAAYKHRLAMVELAVSREPGMEVLTLEQPQFTVSSTLPVLKVKFKESQLYFLLGDDMLEHMAGWPDISELLKSAGLIIAARNHGQTNTAILIDQLQEETGQKVEYLLIDNRTNDVSSRAIRSSLKEQAQSRGLPQAVQKYIETSRLYL